MVRRNEDSNICSTGVFRIFHHMGQNEVMPTFTIEYVYDDRTEERKSHRPDHLAYLTGLVDDGIMLAYGRYDDDGDPGALLIVEAEDAEAVEGLVSGDPYIQAGLVPFHGIRSWPVVWGAIQDRDNP